MKKCIKCGGSGKVSFQIDGGVCYKCEGAGFIGGTKEEKTAAISSKEESRRKYECVNKIAKFLGGGYSGPLYFYELDIQRGFNKDRVRVLRVGAADAALFSEPYIQSFSDDFISGRNDFEQYKLAGISLENRSVTISQKTGTHIEVIFK